MDKDLLLSVNNVSKKYKKRGIDFFALNKVSFDLKTGSTLGIVGESGSGKSTMAKLIMGLQNPTSGELLYKGKKIQRMQKGQKREFRKQVQMVYQDTYSSLNMRMKVEKIISEPLDINYRLSREETKVRVLELLEDVNLPKSYMTKYPWECSGGERQRIAIARAIALNPDLIVCDEAVSSLDMSIQDQILKLLIKLQKLHKMTYVFISHDLAVVEKICDYVLIMKDGHIVEEGNTKDIYKSPQEEYTKELIDSIPRLYFSDFE